ncbi:unnamed protein product, partial [Prorocentrum cordatum]
MAAAAPAAAPPNSGTVRESWCTLSTIRFAELCNAVHENGVLMYATTALAANRGGMRLFFERSATPGFQDGGQGFDTTVMVRSILLRGFDKQCADMIGEFMEKHGVKFARGMVPDKFEKTADGRTKVFVNGEVFGEYDTVLMAIGRTGCAGWLNLK